MNKRCLASYKVLKYFFGYLQYHIYMASRKKANTLVIVRARIRRWHRLLFSSPAEIEFIRIMGGHTTTIKWIKSPRTKFPLVIVWTLGAFLRNEKVSREVRAGRYFLDFANDLRRAVEIDGRAWHSDVVAEQERDEYLAYYGWLVLHIDARMVFQKPAKVRRTVESWLLEGTLPTLPAQRNYSIIKNTEPLHGTK